MNAIKDSAATLDVAGMLRSGAGRDQVIAKMREAGIDKIDSMKLLRFAAGISLGEAKKWVHLSPAWSDRRQADDDFHESIIRNADEL